MGQVRSVLIGMIKRVIEREGESSLEAGVLDASGNNQDNWDGGVGSGDIGVSWEGSTRGESLMLQEGDLIMEMEREAMEAGAGGQFNGNPEEVPESWSGSNSSTLASQGQAGTTLLATIGSRTLPNPVRVPNNIMHLAILRDLMEGPIQPWQCLVWVEHSPPEYSCQLPPLHTSSPNHILLQIGPYYEDINGEYRGEVMEEENDNEGEGASVE